MSEDEVLHIPSTLRVQLRNGRVEEMPLEEYLKGVVPAEMGLQKPLEALKAQAIAARSYAVSTRRHARDNFDVCTTVHCQVWKPDKRYADADHAVDETLGWVVTYGGQIVGAHFFGHCDGHTRNSEEVWSSPVAYYRSVPCICGHTTMHGHGVGMCQRGAAAMAEQESATAVEILTHYYTGVEIRQAIPVPRTAFRRSIILGRVVDGEGQPRGGLRLILSGAGGSVNKGTTADGRFWFTGLPAGRWSLQVRGRPVVYDDLFTDGRNTLDLRVVAPDSLPVAVRSVPLAHPRQLIGTLGLEGVPVTVVDPAGNEQTLLSGSAPDFNPGGFMASLSKPGVYTIRVLGQSFEVTIGEAGLWVEFSAGA